MKKLITPVLFLFYSSLIIAQSADDDYYKSTSPNFLSKDKVSSSISFGTGVSFLNASKSTAFTTYIAPKIGYQITQKFKLNIGLMHYTASGNTFMPLGPNESILNNSSKAITGNFLFVEGQYQLNPKLTMSGAVMFDGNNLNTSPNNFKAVSLGLDYKVSEHASIGIKATVSHRYSGYNVNPGIGNNGYYPNGINSFGGFSPFIQ